LINTFHSCFRHLAVVKVSRPRPEPNGGQMFRRPFSAVNGTFGLLNTMSSTSCNSTDPKVVSCTRKAQPLPKKASPNYRTTLHHAPLCLSLSTSSTADSCHHHEHSLQDTILIYTEQHRHPRIYTKSRSTAYNMHIYAQNTVV
jgi:hypothetical protein